MKPKSIQLAAALLSPLLAGCNMAISDTPMFVEADRSRAMLKDGLWAFDDRECAIKTELPVERWPNCAEWAIVAGNRIVRAKNDSIGDLDTDLFIANGNPLILEMASKPEPDRSKTYHYAALESTVSETDGRIATLKAWLVRCGVEAPGPQSATPQIRPYPGFTPECRPTSLDALRAAAKASRPRANDLGTFKWIRPAD